MCNHASDGTNHNYLNFMDASNIISLQALNDIQHISHEPGVLDTTKPLLINKGHSDTIHVIQFKFQADIICVLQKINISYPDQVNVATQNILLNNMFILYNFMHIFVYLLFCKSWHKHTGIHIPLEVTFWCFFLC